jgi:hypothetical protein
MWIDQRPAPTESTMLDDNILIETKRRRRVVVSGILLPLVIFTFASVLLSRFSRGFGMESLKFVLPAPPLCGDVIMFTSQRHGSNYIMESINNCKVNHDHKYSRTFEFPDYSVDRIRRKNLTTYDSFYKYYQTEPKYSYKIMSDVFYQFYYHVDNFVSQVMNNEGRTFVLLRRRNSVEVFYSHIEHLRQQEVNPSERLTTGVEFEHRGVTVAGQKKDSFHVKQWLHDDYEAYRSYIHRFFTDVKIFAAQKRMPIDELYYEDLVLNLPIGKQGKTVYLPSNKCYLTFCSRDNSKLQFKNERS